MANAILAGRLSSLERALPANDGIDRAAIAAALAAFCTGIKALASTYEVIPAPTPEGMAQVAALRSRR